MSKDSADKLIDGAKLVLLVGLAVLAYHLGAHELALFVAGGALGHAVPTTRRASSAALALVGALAISSAVVGCGASQLRAHATAARMTMVTLAGAGVAIESASQLALDRCPVDDGVERTACIDQVEHTSVAAAAARDALIAPAHAYRDAVLLVQDEDAAKPGLLGYLGVVALALARGWPDFVAAMRALGVPVPEVAIPAIGDAQ